MRSFTETAVAVIGVAISVVGCADSKPEDRPEPPNGALVSEGQAVYAEHCASCHGTQLQGQPNWQEVLPDGAYPAPPHDGSGHTWRHSDQQLFEATKYGGGFSAAPGSVSHMPPFEDVLTDHEIRAALAFVKSRWPTELQARQRLLNRMRSPRGHAGHEGHRSGGAGDATE